MRRTKKDAEQTRRRIMAAARGMFARRGVTRTTLDQVARAARVTRGAIYWHFANKTELFYAMREEVSLPLVDRIGLVRDGSNGNPLDHVERFLLNVIEVLETDATARQTFEIVAFKCEYVSVFERELRRQVKGCDDLRSGLESAYRRAQRAKLLRPGMRPDAAALETCAFLIGLVRLWLMDDRGIGVRRSAARMISEHVRGKRDTSRRRAA
jgi:TetR/AcrR family acrAB operon transcriptional repressor